MIRKLAAASLVLAAATFIGCSGFSEIKKGDSRKVIQVGENADEVKAKIQEWGWDAANHSWAYGVTEWQGSPEATRALSERKAERLRAENDFNDNPFFSVGKGRDASVVELRGKNGVLVRISKRRGREADYDWQGDFQSVTRSGDFRGELSGLSLAD